MTKLKFIQSKVDKNTIVGSFSVKVWTESLEKIGITTFDSLFTDSNHSIVQKLNKAQISAVSIVNSMDPFTIGDFTAFKAMLSSYMLTHSHKFVHSIFSSHLTTMDIIPMDDRSNRRNENQSKRYYGTGNDRLNELLYGGYPSNRIIEIQGKSNVGKTTLMHLLAGYSIVKSNSIDDGIHGSNPFLSSGRITTTTTATTTQNAVIQSQEYCNVLYIDTANGFSLTRLSDYAMMQITMEALNESPSDDPSHFPKRIERQYLDSLQRLTIMKISTIWELLDTLTRIPQESKRYNLIIIDSLYNLLGTLFNQTTSSSRTSISRSTNTSSHTTISLSTMSNTEYLDYLISNLSILSKAIVCDEIYQTTMLYVNASHPTIPTTIPFDRTNVNNTVISSSSSSGNNRNNISTKGRLIDSYLFNEMFDMSILLSQESILLSSLNNSNNYPIAESKSSMGGTYSQSLSQSSENNSVMMRMIQVTRIDFLSHPPIYGGNSLQSGYIQLICSHRVV